MSHEGIKSEHAGARNGGGAWMTRAEVTTTARRQCQQEEKRAAEGDQAPEMTELLESWRTFPDGTPVPNWVAAVDEARRGRETFGDDRYHEGMAHVTKANESVVERRRAAAEQLHGMFAHVAPGVSLADELIADRRAEVRAEERAEAKRRRANG